MNDFTNLVIVGQEVGYEYHYWANLSSEYCVRWELIRDSTGIQVVAMVIAQMRHVMHFDL